MVRLVVGHRMCLPVLDLVVVGYVAGSQGVGR